MKTVSTKALTAIFCLLTIGCDSSSDWSLQAQGDGSTSLSLSPPSFLLDPRVVDQDNLVLRLFANSVLISTELNEQGVRQGELNFDPGDTVMITAAWSDSVNLVELASASAMATVPNDPAGVSVSIGEDNFRTNFDADGDRRSNIAELRAGSDPQDGSSPNEQIVSTPVTISFEIPENLEGEDAATLASLSLVVLVNQQSFTVIRRGNVWSGQGSEFVGNDVFVEANLFTDSTRNELLETITKRQTVGTDELLVDLTD